MKELSLSMEMRNKPQAAGPIVQIATPEMRLDVPEHPAQWRRELERELPNLHEQLLAFEDWAAEQTEASNVVFADEILYPPDGLRATGRYEALVDGIKVLSQEAKRNLPGPIASIHDRPQFKTVIGAPLSHLTQVRHDPAGALTLARLWTHLRAGLYRLPEGIDGFKRLFLRKLREQCGDYRPSDVVNRLVFRRRRVKEVLLNERGETLGCELLVANMDPRYLGQLIRPADRVERYHLNASTRPLAGWRITINLAVNPKVIPAGMGSEVVLVQDPKSNLIGSNCIWLSRPGSIAPSVRDNGPGPGVLCLTVILPAEGGIPTLGAVQRLTSHVLDRLRSIIPWFDDHILAMDLPCIGRDEQSGQSILRPQHLLPIARDPEAGMLGVGFHSPATPYKNVIMTGDACFSGLGIEGSFMAAVQTLERTRRLVKIKNTLA